MAESDGARASNFAAGDADGYELLMGRWSRLLAGSFIDFAGFSPELSTLDVGCGTGAFAEVLGARGGGAITGVDLAESYVRAAAERMPAPRFTFRVADACDLPFEDDTFEQVASLLVLHFVPDPAQALKEMRRVAKPGASVAAAVWDARGGMVFNRIFFDTAAAIDPEADRRRAANYTRPLTRPGELGAALRDAGFHNVREDTRMIRMTYANFEDYWTAADAGQGPIGDYAKSAAPDMLEKVKQAVRRAYLDGEADGPRSYACVAWVAAGAA